MSKTKNIEQTLDYGYFRCRLEFEVQGCRETRIQTKFSNADTNFINNIEISFLS